MRINHVSHWIYISFFAVIALVGSPRSASACPGDDMEFLLERSPDDLREVDRAAAEAMGEWDVLPLSSNAWIPSLTSSSIVVAPDGRTLAVADGENDAVSVMDAQTLELLYAVPVDRRPEQLLAAPDGTIFATCRKASTVAVIGAGERRSFRSIRVGVEPMGMAMTPDASTLYVVNSLSDTLTAIDVGSLSVLWEVPVAPRPVAVTSSLAGDRLYISHLLSDSLTVVDPIAGTLMHSISLNNEDRSEAELIPAFGLNGVMGAVPEFDGEFDAEEPPDGFPEDFDGGGIEFFEPHEGEIPFIDDSDARPELDPSMACAFAVSPGGTRLFVPHALADTGAGRLSSGSVSGVYGGADFTVPIASAMTVIDSQTDAPLHPQLDEGDHDFDRSFEELRFNHRYADAQLPVAVVHHPRLTLLFVVSMGTDSVRVLNSRVAEPATMPVAMMMTGDGPRGIALSADGTRAYVHNELSHDVSVFAIGERFDDAVNAPILSAPYGERVLPEMAARGRSLFHSVDHRISMTGLTCASCHPGGWDDQRVWHLDMGPRQTPMLAERLGGSAPFGWLGSDEELTDHIRVTTDRLSGTGLDDKDLAALATYVAGYLEAPQNPNSPQDGLTGNEEEHGRTIFESELAGCTECHSPDDGFTDGLTHEVGTTSPEEKALWRNHVETATQRMGGSPVQALAAPLRVLHAALSSPVPGDLIAYNTPSLLGLHATAPYLHDGSAATLHDLLRNKNLHDEMGVTSHLTDEELDTLVSYLLTL